MECEQVDLAVVGGGVAGLAAALEACERLKNRTAPARVVLLEASPRIGGKVRTVVEQGYVVDTGPDSFVSTKPGVLEMARRLGIEGELLPQGSSGSYIWSQGRLHRLPPGLMNLVPTQFLPFVTSTLFSWRGKLRMAFEYLIPPRWSEDDESLEHFVVRRLGREALERLAEPLVAGIHAGDPSTMSVRATFPRFIQMEQEYGGLMRAALAARRERRRRRRARQAPEAGPRLTFFMSFREGLEQLVRAMAAALPEGTIQAGVPVERVEPASGGYRLILGERGCLVTRGLILATPAAETARLLRPLDPAAADLVASVPQVSTAIIVLAYRKEAFRKPLEGAGFVVPAAEGRRIMGVTYFSRKWPRPQPDPDVELVRCFVGGVQQPHLAEADEDLLVAVAREELQQMLGIDGPPLFARAFRWPQAMHQYTVGHLERLERLEAALGRLPGLALAGAPYRGVGLPDCIESGLRAARQVVSQLGLDQEGTLSLSAPTAGNR